jgi:hypothetical protein
MAVILVIGFGSGGALNGLQPWPQDFEFTSIGAIEGNQRARRCSDRFGRFGLRSGFRVAFAAAVGSGLFDAGGRGIAAIIQAAKNHFASRGLMNRGDDDVHRFVD